MNRRLLINIRGRQRDWQLPVYADPKHAQDWRADGLDVQESVARGPLWLAWAVRPISAVQAAWQWLRLF